MGVIHGVGGARIQKIRYTFVDASYLRRCVEDIAKVFFNGDDIYHDLILPILTNGGKKTFYYDCMPSKKKLTDEEYNAITQKNIEFYNKIQLNDGWHVYHGYLRRDGKKNTQKGVDVKIAVDMLLHTINGNMNEATLVAGDTDFVPLLEALNQQGMFTRLCFRARNTSRELIYKADSKSLINRNTVYEAMHQVMKEKYELPRVNQTNSSSNTMKIGTIEKINPLSNQRIDNFTGDVNFIAVRENYIIELPRSFPSTEYVEQYIHSDMHVIKAALEEDGYLISWNHLGKGLFNKEGE